MAFEKKTFAPDAVANARRLYEQTRAPLDEVAASLGITRSTLASRIIEWGWTPRKTAKQTPPARRKNRGAAPGAKSKSRRAKRVSSRPVDSRHDKAVSEKAISRKTKPTKSCAEAANPEQQSRKATGAAALAARVQRVVERELDAIDQILGAIGAADAAEAERSARTLASLARALKEVMRLAAPDEPADADDDDPVPRDLDEFRRELARRIEALGAGSAAATSGDSG